MNSFLWAEKPLYNSFLSILHITSEPEKYFFFFLFVAELGREEVDACWDVDIEMREKGEGKGNGTREGEDGRLLDFCTATVFY